MQSNAKNKNFGILPESDYNKVCFCCKWFLRLGLHNNVVKEFQYSFFKQHLLEVVIEIFSTKISVLQKTVLVSSSTTAVVKILEKCLRSSSF